MLNTTKIINITVPKKMYQRIRTEAKKLHESEVFYSDSELKDLLERDLLSSKERKRLDRFFA